MTQYSDTPPPNSSQPPEGGSQAELQQAELQKLHQPVPQEFDIRIAADGSWFHEGGLIGRPALVKLFASVLQREADGTYWLVTPVERGRIEVEDAPFIGVSVNIEGQGLEQQITITTNVGDDVPVGIDHILAMRAPASGAGDLRPYVVVRDGLEACLSRPVFYELAALSVEGPGGNLGVWSHGQFFELDGETAS